MTDMKSIADRMKQKLAKTERASALEKVKAKPVALISEKPKEAPAKIEAKIELTPTALVDEKPKKEQPKVVAKQSIKQEVPVADSRAFAKLKNTSNQSLDIFLEKAGQHHLQEGKRMHIKITQEDYLLLTHLKHLHGVDISQIISALVG